MKATEIPYSPSQARVKLTAWCQRIIQGPHTTNANDFRELGIDVPDDMFSNLGIGEMRLKLWKLHPSRTRPWSHICRISLLSTVTRSIKKKLFALDMIWPHDSQTMWPGPTQGFKPKWWTRCKKFWKGSGKMPKKLKEIRHLSWTLLFFMAGEAVGMTTAMVQFAAMAMARRDSITHNRPSPTICNLCNDTSPAFYLHLRASNKFLYTCNILTISCLHCSVWVS